LALVLILIGVILSAAPVFKRKIKYHKWVNFHKLMGLFYVLGIVHSFNVSTLTSELPIVRTYVYSMAFIGIIAWFYRAFLYNIFNKKYDYVVKTIKCFENDIMEILLKPTNQLLSFKAGQFAFVSYKGMNKNESHPFTISNHSSDDHLRFTVKSLGDYTADLQTSLKEGTKAKVQGAFGHFNYQYGKYKKQLWLAGGIGITPFLSFLRDVNPDYNVILIWSVISMDHANYKDEIMSIVEKNPNIKFVLWDSETKGYFTIDKMYKSTTIKEHSIFICGPEEMRESYIKQLLHKGVSIKDIHYEEFSFR
jgi:predicted ferric reductase